MRLSLDRPFGALSRRRFVALACAIVAAGLLIRIAAGALKTDYHVDEGITLAITNGSWKPPVKNPIFDRWLSKDELERLAFNSNLISSGRPDWDGIARTTAADVHPPLYYWLFALTRAVVGPARHMAACLVLNGLCYAATAAFLALAVLRVNRGDAGRGRLRALVALSLFALTPVCVALTSFTRMYELSQLAHAALVCAAAFIVFPGDAARGVSRPLALAGLACAFFVGVMTHYHFLFFALPLCLVAGAVLAARRELSVLLWSVLSVCAGLFAADAVFPVIRTHLLYSPRSREGFDLASRIFGAGFGPFRYRLSSFAGIALLQVPAITAAIVILAVSAVRRLRARGNSEARGGALPAGETPVSFIMLLAIPCVVAAFAIAATAPFVSLRYLSPLVPVLIVSLVCASLRKAGPSFPERVRILALAAFVSAALCALPGGIPAFHDEYTADRAPAYFRDDVPVILVSNRQGFEWKNLLPYLAIPDRKRVYVTMRYDGAKLMESLEGPLASSGGREAYAMVDALFPNPEGMERVGFYGFFTVYRLKR